MILENADPEVVKACRLRCEIVVERPNEPIHSITRAPADHRKADERSSVLQSR